LKTVRNGGLFFEINFTNSYFKKCEFFSLAQIDVASAETIAKAAGFFALSFGKVQLFQSLLDAKDLTKPFFYLMG